MGVVARFEKGSGKHKYKAVFKTPVNINGRMRKSVSFGHRDYQHYKDTVPKNLGGGKWSHKNHGDASRRAAYRARHGGVKTSKGKKAVNVKYSPAWFSLKYLW